MNIGQVDLNCHTRSTKICGYLFIVLLVISSMSFRTKDKTVTQLNDFVLAIMDNENEIILKKYFPRVYEQEVKGIIYDFFEKVRIDCNKHEKKDVLIKKVTQEIYEIEMGDSKYPILIYKNRCNLKIKSVTALSKGGQIIGWVLANAKFDSDSE